MSHRYFMLHRIKNDAVYVDNIFHELQDYENKLKLIFKLVVLDIEKNACVKGETIQVIIMISNRAVVYRK